MSKKTKSSNKKSNKVNGKIKERNWIAVHAFTRSGAGSHGDNSKYNRKKKHKKKIDRDN